MVESDNDSWEYEYDYDDPELVYITVDFSTHAPPSITSKKSGDDLAKTDLRKTQSMNARKPRKKRKIQEVEAGDGAPTDAPTPGTPATAVSFEDAVEDSPAPPSAVPDNTQPNPEGLSKTLEPTAPSSEQSTLQILDLHTRNPLITYNSQFYTCHWATDVGTSLYITPPPTTHTNPYPPLRSFSSFDLLAKTRARLVAVPARLKPNIAPLATPLSPNQDPFSTPGTFTPETVENFTLSTAEGDTIEYAPTGQLKIHIPANASEAKKSQAAFLERWSELKAQKGWKDPIPVKAMKNYRVPDDWEDERKRWAEVEQREGILGLGKGGEEETGMVRARRRRRGLGEEMVRRAGEEIEGGRNKRSRGPTGRKPGRPRKIAVQEEEGGGQAKEQSGEVEGGEEQDEEEEGEDEDEGGDEDEDEEEEEDEDEDEDADGDEGEDDMEIYEETLPGEGVIHF
ncbi:hypothetical protein C1H76_6187 [Elsinoe australis]|uniref:Transcription factor TFIIIC triple barrel domain-containing protein n=1 Tax=Elsinoe australis TaxID=40998 RepID=A0A4U7AXV1_9PEZI|nr:hypothetical protein C1H76_6187 [Elsinoe australis]